MVQKLLAGRDVIAVAGIHGKTTTSSLVASILASGGLDPTFVIGGRLNSAGANARLGSGEYIVVEADESDATQLALADSAVICEYLDEVNPEPPLLGTTPDRRADFSVVRTGRRAFDIAAGNDKPGLRRHRVGHRA